MEKYLATDLDGTLLFPKFKYKYVSQKNINILKLFNDKIIIVSGRNQTFIKKICKALNLEETYIACNGAVICYKGQEIFINHLENKLIFEIINHIKNTFDQYNIILFESTGKLYSLSENKQRVTSLEKEYKIKNPKTAYTTNKDEKKIKSLLKKKNTITKINIALQNEDKINLYNHLLTKNYDLSYAICKGSLEITSKNINKGSSLKLLTQYMNINEKDVYVVGDDKNDVSMFKEYKNSFLIKTDNNADLCNHVKYVLTKFEDLKLYIKED